MPVPPLRPTKALEALAAAHASLSSKLGALYAAGERWQGMLQHFVEIVCTDYSVLIRMHATSYRSNLMPHCLLHD